MLILSTIGLDAQVKIYSLRGNHNLSGRLLPVKENGRWGLIDRNGVVVLPPKYQHISDVSFQAYCIVCQNGKFGLLDTSMREILPTAYNNITPLSPDLVYAETDTGSALFSIQTMQTSSLPGAITALAMIEERLPAVKVTDKWFLWSLSATDRTAAGYDTIIRTGKFIFGINGFSRIPLTHSGSPLLDVKIKECKELAGGNLLLFKNDGGWGLCNDEGEVLVAPKWAKTETLWFFNTILFRNDSITGIFNMTEMRLICETLISKITSVCNDFYITSHENKIGLISIKTGKYTTAEYDDIICSPDDYLFVKKNNEWGIVNSQAKIVIPCQYDHLQMLDKNFILLTKNGKRGIAHKSGKILLAPQANVIIMMNNVAKVYTGDGLEIIRFSSSGSILSRRKIRNFSSITLNNRVLFNDSAFFKSTNNNGWFLSSSGLWGLKDSTGRIIIKPDYIRITHLNGRYTLVEREIAETSLSRRCRVAGIGYDVDSRKGLFDNLQMKFKMRPDFVYIDTKGIANGGCLARGIQVNTNVFCYSDATDRLYNNRVTFVDKAREGFSRINFGGVITPTPDSRDKEIICHKDVLSDDFAEEGLYENTSDWNFNRTPQYLKISGGKWAFLDDKGAAHFFDTWDFVEQFQNHTAIVQRENFFNVIDSLGQPLFPEKTFTDITRTEGNDSVFLLKKKTTGMGLMTIEGKIIAHPVYHQFYDTADGMIRVSIGKTFGYVSVDGTSIIAPKFKKANDFSEGFAAVRPTKYWGFIDKEGQIKIECKYRKAGNFHNGLAWVVGKNDYQFITQAGEPAFDKKFASATDFCNGIAVVRKGKKYGVINTKGNFVIKPKYKKIKSHPSGKFVLASRGKGYVMIGSDGNKMVNRRYTAVGEFHEGIAWFRQGGRYGYIDVNGKIIIKSRFAGAKNFSNGMAEVKNRKNLWGFIDKTGNQVIDYKYRITSPFSCERAVVFNNIWACIINKQGGVVNDSSFRYVSSYHSGQALVRTKKGCYFIDIDGKKSTGKVYDDAKPFKNGVAFVKNKKLWAVIDTLGNNITSYKYFHLFHYDDERLIYDPGNIYGLANMRGFTFLPVAYDYTQYAGNGLYRIESGNAVGYISTNSRWLWRPAN
ncbi:MAG: WG repeat-containing protein [Bacteroidetes bacterium]|nr:WG repeat-containing protein [Bacteroidota bacterium]MBU1721033.1 WG repeat-containing protein [Bacteroidota bacterium]